MKINKLCWSVYFFSILTLTACGSAIKIDRRSPILPTFTDMEHDGYSESNPFFSSVTQFYDKQKLKLSDGTIYRPYSPTLVSPIGTYYRLQNPLFIYAMTSGLGFQYDLKTWSRSKVSLGLFGGYYQNHGVSLSYSQQVSRLWSGPVLTYLSLQRRASRNFVQCYSARGDPCSDDTTTGGNSLRMREDVFNPILGLQLGRFKIGDEGRTTVYFKLELGYNHVLSRKLTYEHFASEYTHSDGPFVGTEFGFTLW